MNNDKLSSNGYVPAQAISQQERDLIAQQLPKWLNGFETEKEEAPSPTAKLWNPKYSGLGFVVIVLVILVIDVLPRLIRSKLNAATTPEPIELNELESILVAKLDSLSSDAS